MAIDGFEQRRFMKFSRKIAYRWLKPADFRDKPPMQSVDLGPRFAYTRGLTGRLALRLRLHLLLGTSRI